jgi:DNA-binding FadR family transcriptional regulator
MVVPASPSRTPGRYDRFDRRIDFVDSSSARGNFELRCEFLIDILPNWPYHFRVLQPHSDPATVEPHATAIETVFERLLKDIVQGVHPSGARLPAERELSRQLGASRPTLREALRRLGEWNLVEPRRGSGVMVKPYRDWSIEVIPAYVKWGKPQPGQPSIPRMLSDLFSLRRALVLEVLKQTAGRIPPGSLHPARAATARAWSVREQRKIFPREDFEVMRCIVESSGFVPGLWLLNRISQIWFDMVDTIAFAIVAPNDYVETYSRFFELCDTGKSNEAFTLIATYIERHDAEIMKILEALA